MAVRPDEAGRNAILDSGLDAFDGGTLEIRTGSQPTAGGGTATGTLLATITLPTPAFAAAASGGRAPTGTWQNTVAESGTAGWARMEESGGGASIDFAIGEGSGDLSLDETALVAGGTVSVTGGSVSLPGNDG